MAKIFMDTPKSMKSTKTFTLENFRLYGMLSQLILKSVLMRTGSSDTTIS